ncbi:dynein heavy chain and region D6 of dynein motor-domain-containing protein [Lentinula raphanica]|nr:dynein heavy chain and region D6 of dynein motor-domain-containing protein [Lentinula raphanica]
MVVEYLNSTLISVLDDNKRLTLSNGERPNLPPNVRIMFEVEHLKYATLATVSRCGMIWFSEDIVEPSRYLVNHPIASDEEDAGDTLARRNNEILPSDVAASAALETQKQVAANISVLVFLLGRVMGGEAELHTRAVCDSRTSTASSSLSRKKVYRSPFIIDVMKIQGIQKNLERLADLLNKIKKALGDKFRRFIKTDPTYAGRYQLPPNLTKLFRLMATTRPDRELIAQVMLFSQGFRTAESLSSKIVPFFNLCDEQLSLQPHYDFGLRALKAVLASAGILKRDRLLKAREQADANDAAVGIHDYRVSNAIEGVVVVAKETWDRSLVGIRRFQSSFHRIDRLLNVRLEALLGPVFSYSSRRMPTGHNIRTLELNYHDECPRRLSNIQRNESDALRRRLQDEYRVGYRSELKVENGGIGLFGLPAVAPRVVCRRVVGEKQDFGAAERFCPPFLTPWLLVSFLSLPPPSRSPLVTNYRLRSKSYEDRMKIPRSSDPNLPHSLLCLFLPSPSSQQTTLHRSRLGAASDLLRHGRYTIITWKWALGFLEVQDMREEIIDFTDLWTSQQTHQRAQHPKATSVIKLMLNSRLSAERTASSRFNEVRWGIYVLGGDLFEFKSDDTEIWEETLMSILLSLSLSLSALLHALVKTESGSQTRDGLTLDSPEVLYRWFTQQVAHNLLVVFTKNPPANGLASRAATSPALFNGCVLDWFGNWSDQAFYQGIIHREDFIQRIVNFDTTSQMTKGLRDLMKRDFLSQPSYNFETVNRASKACGPLVKWALAQIKFSEILDPVEPLRKEVLSLEQQAETTDKQALRVQMTTFLMNEYKDWKITVTSFLDEAFFKDVEQLDPIHNAVLNKEIRRTRGCVLIRLGSQDIDFSPLFTMFLSTGDPSVEFSPDICSRVTFVNFTMTRSSLQSQSLDQVLKVERPDTECKSMDLMKIQGEFRLCFRTLEKLLLQALDESSGNILDDDKVIDTLETLKREAADITCKVEDTDVVMKEVEQVTAEYLPLAQACKSGDNVLASAASNENNTFLTTEQAQGLDSFAKNSVFKPVVTHLNAHEDEWRSFLESNTPEASVPMPWEPSTRRFYFLLLILDFQLIHVLAAVEALRSMLIIKCAMVLDEVPAATPLALISVTGYDASYRVENLIKNTGARSSSVAMGSQEGFSLADQAIASAARQGTWVLLKNVHLAPDWLDQLEKKLQTLNPHRNFWLFLTMEANPSIPVNILRQSRLLMNEPPPGVKANLLDSLRNISPSRLSQGPAEKTVAQEHLRYVPLGWSKVYDFNDSDMSSALDTIDTWHGSFSKGRANIDPATIPWDALRTLIKQSDTACGNLVNLPVYLNNDRSDMLFTVDLPFDSSAGLLAATRAACLTIAG